MNAGLDVLDFFHFLFDLFFASNKYRGESSTGTKNEYKEYIKYKDWEQWKRITLCQALYVYESLTLPG